MVTVAVPLITELARLGDDPSPAAAEYRNRIREHHAALDIHAIYRADKNQVTIRATITSTTPGIVAALLADPRTGSDSSGKAPAPRGETDPADPRADTNSASKTPVPFGKSNTIAIITESPNTSKTRLEISGNFTISGGLAGGTTCRPRDVD